MSKKKQPRYGDPLPACPIALGSLPIGVAVRLESTIGWWISAFRIGVDGPVSMRPIPDPNDPQWHRASATGERTFGATWIVVEAQWPARILASGTEIKP